MADHVDITLWIDRRWKVAIEKHLRDETLEEHLEDVLNELCNQLPEREYERISAEIYAEDVAQRAEEEAARTYAAYHVTECGQEWYFKTSLGEELLDAAEKLRGYATGERDTAPDLFMFMGTQCDLWGRPDGTGHEKISRGNFPRLIFSLIPSLSVRQHFIGYADLIHDSRRICYPAKAGTKVVQPVPPRSAASFSSERVNK